MLLLFLLIIIKNTIITIVRRLLKIQEIYNEKFEIYSLFH